ncbi:MAG: hypothetical protein A07HN63_00206 [uncultured archaeon A07HN63]|nr:MAG: hypothetical protein A07HN63_00206 [uncultured archaeon A07HN63]
MVILALLNLAAGLLATAVVVVDTHRRGLSPRVQAGWVGFVAISSIGGSVAVAVGDTVFLRLLQLGMPLVVVTPFQLLTTVLIAGLTLSALAVLTYGVGSRYGPLATA